MASDELCTSDIAPHRDAVCASQTQWPQGSVKSPPGLSLKIYLEVVIDRHRLSAHSQVHMWAWLSCGYFGVFKEIKGNAHFKRMGNHGKDQGEKKERSKKKSQNWQAKLVKRKSQNSRWNPELKESNGGFTEWKIILKNFTQKRAQRDRGIFTKMKTQIRKSKDSLKVVNFSLTVAARGRNKGNGREKMPKHPPA